MSDKVHHALSGFEKALDAKNYDEAAKFYQTDAVIVQKGKFGAHGPKDIKVKLEEICSKSNGFKVGSHCRREINNPMILVNPRIYNRNR